MTEQQPQQAIPIKIIMVGAMNVGKTSLVTKFATGKTPGQTKTTKNASYVSKRKTINNLNFEIKLWDTAGQEKYKSLTKLFTKDAKIAILVYSVDSEESFKDLDDWLKLVRNSNEDNIILGVAGNKSDLASDKTISEDRGKEYAKKIGAEFKSTSAMIDNGGIEEFIETLFTKYHSTNFNMDQTASLSLTISMEDSRAQKGGCCGASGGNKATANKQSAHGNKKNKNSE
jgi:small GTP-binding protein